LLFLIFGTDRKAAFFLPCYYVPPEKSRRQFPTFPDESVDVKNIHFGENVSDNSILCEDNTSNESSARNYS
jgi:hypothetical protein